MGVHVGEARLTTSGGTYLGFGLHEAARVADAGAGGQIVVSSTRARPAPTRCRPGRSWSASAPFASARLEADHELLEVRGPGLPSGFPPLRIRVETIGNIPAEPFEMVGRHEELAAVVASVTSRPSDDVGRSGRRRQDALGARRRAAPERARRRRVLVRRSRRYAGEGERRRRGRRNWRHAVDRGQSWCCRSGGGNRVGRALLLVLDNCEHLLDSVVDNVHALLAASSQVRVLATSQAPLSLRREHVIRVEPLSMADAATLFVAHAIDARADGGDRPKPTPT